jgi:23S rRNA (adenine2503-C2)-methyltransferase
MSQTLALNLNEKDWSQWFVANGDKAFRGRQIMDWLFIRHQFSPNEFSNIPKHLREKLNIEFNWSLPHIDTT